MNGFKHADIWKCCGNKKSSSFTEYCRENNSYHSENCFFPNPYNYFILSHQTLEFEEGTNQPILYQGSPLPQNGLRYCARS